jgi:hypothetical protein
VSGGLGVFCDDHPASTHVQGLRCRRSIARRIRRHPRSSYPVFHPLLAFKDGSTLNTAQLADAANEAYAWNLSSDVVESLIPQFIEQGWIQSIETNEKTSVYRVTCHLPDGAFYSDLTDELKQLEKEFCRQTEQQSPLFFAARSRDDLLSLLLRWVVSLDVYDFEQLRKTADSVETTPAPESLNANVRFSTDEQFVCASFIRYLHDAASPLIDTVAHVVQVGLLAEAAEDFARPMTAVNRTGLIIYLDGPVAMDLLNVSGKEAYQNIRLITERLKTLGGTFRIFDDSVVEIQRNLRALFRRDPAQRTGPTATAIRNGEVLETYVREIQARPVPALERAGVQVISRPLDQFPNEHKFFDEDCYRDLYSQIQWHLEDSPRAHDTLVVTNIMRMRRGNQTTDLFEAGHVLVTRNAALVGASKRIAVNHAKINRFSVGPVVHQRQLATAVWLRAGLNDADRKSIPMHLLLASCERVLQLRPDVVQKARHFAQQRGPETAEQLDLLLTVDRSTQVLMERTLNTASVVDEAMFDDILQSMRESLIAEKAAEYDSEIRRVQREAVEERERLKEDAKKREETLLNTLTSAQTDASQQLDQLTELSNEDNLAIDALLNFTNTNIARRKSRAGWAITAIAVAIDLVLVGLWIAYPSRGLLALLGIALLTTVSHLIGKFQTWTRFGEITREIAEAMLWVEAAHRGIDPKLRRVSLEFKDQQFMLAT